MQFYRTFIVSKFYNGQKCCYNAIKMFETESKSNTIVHITNVCDEGNIMLMCGFRGGGGSRPHLSKLVKYGYFPTIVQKSCKCHEKWLESALKTVEMLQFAPPPS